MSVGSVSSCPLDAYTSQYASQLSQAGQQGPQALPSAAIVPPNPAPVHGPAVNDLGQRIGGLISTTA